MMLLYIAYKMLEISIILFIKLRPAVIYFFPIYMNLHVQIFHRVIIYFRVSFLIIMEEATLS